MVEKGIICKELYESLYDMFSNGENDPMPREPQQILVPAMLYFDMNVMANYSSGSGKTIAFCMIII
jgi:hypothetical protein